MEDEVHSDHKMAWERFQESVEYVKDLKVFTVGLPWNDKKDMLPTNKVQAAARTRRQQIIFLKDKVYADKIIEAKAKLLEEKLILKKNLKE